MEAHKNGDIKNIYKYLDELILNSESYGNYISMITSNHEYSSKLNEIFTFSNEEGFDATLAEKSFKDLNAIEEISSVIGLEDAFSHMLLESVRDGNLINTVVNTKLIETMYGNSTKEDFDINDVLFTILEAVFGLDSLLKSVYDKDEIMRRFAEVIKDSDEFDFIEFLEVFSNFYYEAQNEKDYNKIKEIAKKYESALMPYIMDGINNQIDNISNSSNDLFNDYKVLYNKITDIYGKCDLKKM